MATIRLNQSRRDTDVLMHSSASFHRKIAELEDFVEQFYAQKDMMHDLSHIRRFLKTARSLSKRYHRDDGILTYAAYFHGIDRKKHKDILKGFLESQGLQKRQVDRVFRVAKESQKESRPATMEGMILHDAHLIEGGRTFLAVKSLVTGLQQGDTLPEIIEYFEKEVDGRFKCYLPEICRFYSEKEEFARRFFHDLKKNL